MFKMTVNGPPNLDDSRNAFNHRTLRSAILNQQLLIEFDVGRLDGFRVIHHLRPHQCAELRRAGDKGGGTLVEQL